MKKLVTIVSAVMMLLMLAACAPTIDYSAEDMEQIEKGQQAISVIMGYALQEYQAEEAKLEEGEEMPATWTLSVTDDKTYQTVTIEAGAYVEFTLDDEGNYANLEVKGSVTGDFGGTEDETVSVEYYSTADEFGPFKVNGKGYYPTLVALGEI